MIGQGSTVLVAGAGATPNPEKSSIFRQPALAHTDGSNIPVPSLPLQLSNTFLARPAFCVLQPFADHRDPGSNPI